MDQAKGYNVGGVVYPRPFKIRRLGHFGFNVENFDKALDFYSRLLGLRITDDLDVKTITGAAKTLKGIDDTHLIFMTHSTDHHAFLLASRQMGAIFGDDAGARDITLNQITWQVGTLDEVVKSQDYLREKGVPIRRVGRDMPGSNWHCYARDPDGYTVELYYGMEQVGWDGRSKPLAMYNRRFDTAPALPQISERTEIEDAEHAGIDVLSGFVRRDLGTGKFNVGGVMLPRPFKITRIGPIRLFVEDVGVSEAFYTQIYGFQKIEEVVFEGHRCVYLRSGVEHHSLALFPRALRERLGLSTGSSCLSAGFELGSYEQLRDAVAFLKREGVRFVSLPDELHPGIDYAAHILDPDGQCLQLYYYMEQIGWDGKPRPAALRRKVQKDWPNAIEALSDTYSDQSFLGPLG